MLSKTLHKHWNDQKSQTYMENIMTENVFYCCNILKTKMIQFTLRQTNFSLNPLELMTFQVHHSPAFLSNAEPIGFECSMYFFISPANL